MTGVVQTSSESTGSIYKSPLIVSRDSLNVSSRMTARSTTYSSECHYILLI